MFVYRILMNNDFSEVAMMWHIHHEPFFILPADYRLISVVMEPVLIVTMGQKYE
ncbi:hypothetical protein [Fusibacter ferrireducens]|uniref:AraC family transcriptional regulator n=1 Tax=Fusibacter ferrireducens TaxID=2785058 RepID=A0ABR9ZXI0_9FIRM|nr:hypothetical protein [Fusibacter ferrireducens]MBF4695173.1 hypothetical protein [Fusibacter ferrireducens]